jgi:hypothetical protein
MYTQSTTVLMRAVYADGSHKSRGFLEAGWPLCSPRILLHVECSDKRLYLNLCVLSVKYEDTRIPFAHLPLETETIGNNAQKPLYTHDGVSEETQKLRILPPESQKDRF